LALSHGSACLSQEPQALFQVISSIVFSKKVTKWWGSIQGSHELIVVSYGMI